MLHLAISLATCVAAKLRDKLRDKLHSVTAPLIRQTFDLYKQIIMMLLCGDGIYCTIHN